MSQVILHVKVVRQGASRGIWGRCVLSCYHRLARAGATLGLMHRNVFDGDEMLVDGDALDQRGLPATQYYFFNRKRRFFVNRFRNNWRRDRFWKHAEFACYLLERLLLVGPV